MWPFKKKVKKDEFTSASLKVSRHKHYKDRFIIEVYKDEHRYKIDVFDKWSKRYLSDKDRDKGKLFCQTLTFDLIKNENEITEAIKIQITVEKMKNALRDDFVRLRNKELKNSNPKKKKKIKKEVK
ncbi:unnamed protein product [marine sediment metagenome]|uniref:Uncharacterized protein n=1 Tax=marine sediment metagenome TaxID=412755 RepID=X1IVY7_9ZZZZ